ncbi:50S ribosomal protein L3 [Candidatus Woesearchaeota archaeon CG_4_10_14_0_8_um_filter_47_5]|nr:MAG: 50S ribosomal protein L3 [Candidatus Woesearchaeota archaeon CG_4_10_14_0_8_um_filter_47_5]
MVRHSPHKGTMQFWPRKRAKRPYARVRYWPQPKDKKGLLGFAGYKVGMTHLIVEDNRPTSKTKGAQISFPATIVECPPLRIHAVRAYTYDFQGRTAHKDYLIENEKQPKDLVRKLRPAKKRQDFGNNLAELEKNLGAVEDIVVLVTTQPSLTGIGKKKPEICEMGLGGTLQEKIAFIRENAPKEVQVDDVFSEGEQTDIHAITKGKGFQGPVKRHGVNIRSHKAEKTKRGPASLGPWHPAKVRYTVPHAGQTGYHQRIEYNKLIIKIGKNPGDISQKGGFLHYGVVKNPYLIVKGSVMGTQKRLIRFTFPRRAKKLPKQPPAIVLISQSSKQGN